jgi:hypothetical protein
MLLFLGIAAFFVRFDRVKEEFAVQSNDFYLKWADGHPIQNPNYCVLWYNATLKTVACDEKHQPICETT